MSLFADLEEIVKYDVPMAEHTWFRLGGPAKYYVEPTSEEQLLEVVHRCHDNNVPFYVLGRGSNLLVADQGVERGRFILLAALVVAQVEVAIVVGEEHGVSELELAPDNGYAHNLIGLIRAY